jgi:hypothetical protein
MFLAWPYFIAACVVLVAVLLRRNRDVDWPTRIFICTVALVVGAVFCYVISYFLFTHFAVA